MNSSHNTYRNQIGTLKKYYIANIIIFTAFFTIHAQIEDGIGIKAGINFGSTGTLNSSSYNTTVHSEGTNLEFGAHLGIFSKQTLNKTFYIRPELLFVKRKNSYTFVSPDKSEYLSLSTIQLPLLMGYKISTPLSLYLGPSINYIIDKSIDSPAHLKIKTINRDIDLSIQLGIAFNLNKFCIDLRYENALSKNELEFYSQINSNFSGTIDTKTEQITLSVSYKLLSL